ncbi:Smr/MutS family protein [Pseudoroseicyclus aestuarii]|uniref:DNA-nicking Smr family endonuclease n=1 Tax=Pseudoroseicyclus aestuarii TaxID=1795041 RepID=A0A318SR86_9RHOB|nr:Smr/MutS family protein [Pseudoroseicyclus aestuarii]PYE84451.1 DNA-nicking Smr family endonuclease [Pseudoroseicyclus aestuarii]
MRRRRRDLSPEERDLWNSVARQADPLHRRPARHEEEAPAPKAPPAETSRPDNAQMPPPAQAFQVGQKAQAARPHDLLDPLPSRLKAAPVRMDAKAHGRLKKGKLRPEGRIDLHGMTLADAHPALAGFILTSQAQGRRLVLVITGKGRPKEGDAPMPVRHGQLRHEVPHWLNLPPLAQAVLQITPAHFRHGGEGAYYVYLRRLR